MLGVGGSAVFVEGVCLLGGSLPSCVVKENTKEESVKMPFLFSIFTQILGERVLLLGLQTRSSVPVPESDGAHGVCT